RNFLSKRLPDYMVPSIYVFLEAFPLTPNGKVNRLALPAPDPTTTEELSYVAPRDEFEVELAVAWAEVLGLPRVGIHDNFFDLGGHSLLAVQLGLRIQQILPGEPISLATLMDAPTIERFATFLRSRESHQRRHVIRVREGRPSRLPFF